MSSCKRIKGENRRCGLAAALLLLFILTSASFTSLMSPGEPPSSAEIPSRIASGPVQNGTVILHMHWDGTQDLNDDSDVMNTLGPYSPALPWPIDYDGDGKQGSTLRKYNPSNKYLEAFSLTPQLSSGFRILGGANFTYWGQTTAAGNNSLMDFTFELFDSADAVLGGDVSIGVSSTVTFSILTEWRTYSINLNSLDYTMPAGHYLIGLLSRLDNVNDDFYLMFDQSFWDTTLRLDTTGTFSITDHWSSSSDMLRRTEFGDQETMSAFANVTDAFGAFDINNASFRVLDESDWSVECSIDMSVFAIDTSPLPNWKLFEGDFGPLAAGNYSVNVTVEDQSGGSANVSWSLKISSLDHFDVSLDSSAVSAGQPFNLTVTAIDSGNDVMENWSGTVTIVIIDNSTGLQNPVLSNLTIFMSSSSKGSINITMNITLAPLIVRLMAVNGTVNGSSGPLSVLPGSPVALTVSPMSITLHAGEDMNFSAVATDQYGNTNTSWSPSWTLSAAIANVSINGYVATVHAVTVGNTNLTCEYVPTGIKFNVSITIISSPLSRIAVTPQKYVVYEGEMILVTAVGFDAWNNTVDIAGAIWSSESFAMTYVVGIGANGVLFAGMIPEVGSINVSLNGISGKTDITIIVPPNGPSISSLPNQFGYEDQSWSIDLSAQGYWKDSDNLETLSWFVTGVNDSLLLITHAQSASNVTIIPQPNAFGVDEVTFWVRDGDGYTNYKVITITIVPVNDAPEFVNNPPTEIYVKFNLAYSFNYSYYVRDVDNPKSALEIVPTPSTYITVNGRTLTYTYPDLYGGTEYYRLVTLVVSDGSLSDSLAIKVWVTSDTPPELVLPLPDITINEGDIDVPAFDLDSYFTDIDGDILYYTQGYEHIEIEIVNGTNMVLISSPSEWSGQTTASFTARDPKGALMVDTIIVTVLPVNDPPSIAYIPKVYVRYSAESWLDLRLYILDPDNGFDELTIYTNDPLNASYVSLPYPHLTLLYPENASGGPYTGPYEISIMLHAEDSLGLSADRSFIVHVSDDYPPFLNRTPPELLSFYEDSYLSKPYSIDLKAIFADPDMDVLTFTFEGNSNISIVVETDGWVNLSAEPNWFGTEQVTFIARDYYGAWASFRVRIDVLPVNDPPELRQIPDLEHLDSKQWSESIKQYVSDIDDPTLAKIEVVILQPTFVAAVALELYFDFPSNLNSTTVILYVTDGEDSSRIISFDVVIKYTSDEPTWEELIGYPWSLIAILLIAGIIGYVLATRIVPHELEEIFIIHNDGRLIHHAGKSSEGALDQDVVSAMFTALQEFIKDSFKGETGGLKMLEIGDKKVVIEKGKWIYAALFYTGMPPKGIFKDLIRFINDIEYEFGKYIEHWDGTLKDVYGIQLMTQEIMNKKYHKELFQRSPVKRKPSGASLKLDDLKAETPDEQKEGPKSP